MTHDVRVDCHSLKVTERHTRTRQERTRVHSRLPTPRALFPFSVLPAYLRHLAQFKDIVIIPVPDSCPLVPSTHSTPVWTSTAWSTSFTSPPVEHQRRSLGSSDRAAVSRVSPAFPSAISSHLIQSWPHRNITQRNTSSPSHSALLKSRCRWPHSPISFAMPA